MTLGEPSSVSTDTPAARCRLSRGRAATTVMIARSLSTVPTELLTLTQKVTILKGVAKHYPKEMKGRLDEVIEAAETVDLARLRKEATAAIDELKRKGPGYRRDISFWGQVGQGALALGCIGAAAVGQVEFGIPCVVGGALSSAGLRMWEQK